MFNLFTRIILLTSLMLIQGCALFDADFISKMNEPPEMEQVSVPMEQDSYEPLTWPLMEEDEEDDSTQHVNSLWQSGTNTFFKDKKARKVGDILKVMVRIKDKAELENETEATRNNTEDTQASSLFGLEKLATGFLPGKANPADLLNIATDSKSTGTGTIEREEIIETEVAAMVTQVLPNGNLVIHGDQEIRVNHEIRRVSVDGIIRADDIQADNTIDSNQIAQSRISYGGRGIISRVQRPRLVHQLVDEFSPF